MLSRQHRRKVRRFKKKFGGALALISALWLLGVAGTIEMDIACPVWLTAVKIASGIVGMAIGLFLTNGGRYASTF